MFEGDDFEDRPVWGWDSRDLELGVRDRLAEVVAMIVSGTPGAIPEQSDYDIADAVRVDIERAIVQYL